MFFWLILYQICYYTTQIGKIRDFNIKFIKIMLKIHFSLFLKNGLTHFYEILKFESLKTYILVKLAILGFQFFVILPEIA